jgi:hypothetical protein
VNAYHRRRAGVILAAALVGAALGAPAGAAATTLPPTLSGAFLSAYPAYIPTSSIDILATCDPAGTSTISWSVSGDSTALFGTPPYPGSFVETGTATISPQAGPNFVNGIPLGDIVTLEAFFSIDSPVGQVMGSLRMVASTTARMGGCNDLDGFVLPDGEHIVSGEFRRLFMQWGTYEALILADGAAYLDSGEADLLLEHFVGTGMQEVDAVQGSFRSLQSEVIPAPPGRATGGGRVGDVTFGFNALRDKSGPKGRCAVVDATSDVQVRCLDVGMIGVFGNRATITGNAVFNDAPVQYRMTVVDAAESGAGADTWTISLSNGYSAGGTLTEGNVQVSAK